MKGVIARRPTFTEALYALEDCSRASGLPLNRCVWVGLMWGHAARRWALPELLVGPGRYLQ
jgi:hypothetical protein